MIAKSYIEKNLNQLNQLFNDARTTKKMQYFSKLAMLELCGWIEESMDDIVQKCANRTLKENTNKNYISNQVIKRNYGFEYDKHFRKMLMCVIGLGSIEKLEKKIDFRKYAMLKSSLNNLKVSRNREAHTHLKGVTRTVDAPSVTIRNFNHVYAGLKEIENKLKTLSL